MNAVDAEMVIGAVTLVLSIVSSAVIASYRTGKAEGKFQADMEYLKLQMAEIKGMFVLKLRDHADK